MGSSTLLRTAGKIGHLLLGWWLFIEFTVKIQQLQGINDTRLCKEPLPSLAAFKIISRLTGKNKRLSESTLMKPVG